MTPAELAKIRDHFKSRIRTQKMRKAKRVRKK